VWSDGQYIYFADGTSGLVVLSFDGSSFTVLDTDDPGDVQAVWGDGTYIYAGDAGGGVHAYSFDGTTLTLLDSEPSLGFVYSFGGDGQYIYAGTNPQLYALTFDGTALTVVESIHPGAGTNMYTIITADQNYIYARSNNNAIYTFTFDGTAFTEVDSDPVVNSAFRAAIWTDEDHIYMADNTSGLRAFSGFGRCDGGSSSLTQIVPDGLVGHWRLDETSGTTAFDSRGEWEIMEQCRGGLMQQVIVLVAVLEQRFALMAAMIMLMSPLSHYLAA
jgi:hypothetical protein